MRVLIVFASMSGNTEDMAELIKAELATNGVEMDMEEMDGYNASELLNYDGVLIGSYTWGDGDLPYEAEDFAEELAELDLTGVIAAVFGSGDRVYPAFCEAVHTFESILKNGGATVTAKGLEIEFDPNTDEERAACRSFANTFLTALKQRQMV
ncbi:MAG: flavodoxin [Shouchella clausii]|jgi:flavodoxin I